MITTETTAQNIDSEPETTNYAEITTEFTSQMPLETTTVTTKPDTTIPQTTTKQTTTTVQTAAPATTTPSTTTNLQVLDKMKDNLNISSDFRALGFQHQFYKAFGKRKKIRRCFQLDLWIYKFRIYLFRIYKFRIYKFINSFTFRSIPVFCFDQFQSVYTSLAMKKGGIHAFIS